MFTELLNLTLDENELFKLAAEEVRANFETFGADWYCLYLTSRGEYVSSVEKIVTFKGEEYMDFVYSHPRPPLCIWVKIWEGEAHMLLQGYYYSGTLKFDQLKTKKFNMDKRNYKRNPIPLPPREVLIGAFAEIEDALKQAGDTKP